MVCSSLGGGRGGSVIEEGGRAFELETLSYLVVSRGST